MFTSSDDLRYMSLYPFGEEELKMAQDMHSARSSSVSSSEPADGKDATAFGLRDDISVLSLDLDEKNQATDGLLQKDGADLEAQPVPQQQESSSTTPAEYSVSTSKKLAFLATYFVVNLVVTLSNKAVLKTASLPWLLTFNHTFATSVGCSILLATGYFKLTRLSTRENLILVAFSTLFTINIAISNVSLAVVSVPFHQVARSTSPVVTILIYRFVMGRTYSRSTYISLIPLIFGVALATFGDYYFTGVGFFLTFLGVGLASTKTVVTNQLMTGSLKLSAIEILFRMSPLAAIQCLLYALATGEIWKFQQYEVDGAFTFYFILGLIGNASLAFCLNMISFQTNKVAGALTISVCGNVKQCLTILLGIVLFNVHITPINGVGMFIAVSGAAWYSKVELDRKRAASS